ncbi:MAG: 39S ribosomal protein L45 [Holosporales bacterium]|jgi:predicted lipid-binding transport protein (Tim44 family)|nr:39S ribosomal protein L45 [Holosporales bacterium]
MFVVTVLTASLSALFLIILIYKFGRIKGALNQHHELIGGNNDVAVIAISDPARPEPVEPKGLAQLKQKFPNFVLSDFLNQAEEVFDSIFAAFIASDCNALKSKLTTAVYRVFFEQIQRREEKNLRQEIVINHTETTLDQIQNLVTKANLFISFKVSQMNAIVNSDGISLDNPNKIYRNILHRWMFERKYSEDEWILAKISSIEI